MIIRNFITHSFLITLIIGNCIAQVPTTTPNWYDQTPASGCKSLKVFLPGQEIYYHHVSFDIPYGTSVVWDDSLPYYLDKDIKVYGELTVRPGTWIFSGTYASLLDSNYNSTCYGYPSSLLIMEGGKAHMVGTKDSVIVMTGYGDDFRDINTLGPGAKGLWGGLVIKGKAPVSNAGYNGTYPVVEGLPGYEPDSIMYFGNKGNDPNDNSGEYSYLSVRHSGWLNPMNSALNGIGLHAVGAGTRMDHIEVISTVDDGIEIDGGNVNIKYIVNAFCGDDQFDIDQGYSGKIQYALGLELGWLGNRCGEWDGKKNFNDPNPTANPTICNMTLISSGKYTTNNLNDQNFGNRYIIQMADSLKGDYRNFIMLDGSKYAFWMRNHDLKGNYGKPGQASIGDINGPKVSGFMVYNTGVTLNNTTAVWDSLITDDNGASSLAADIASLKTPANKNFCNVDPMLRGVSRGYEFAALDPRPAAGSPALSPNYYVANPSDGFFDQTNFTGAFGASDLWCDGWTKLSQSGVLTGYLSVFPAKEIIPSNASFDLTYSIKIPNAIPTNAMVLIDGVDYTSSILPIFIANNGPLTNGGIWVKVPSLPVSAIPTGNTYMGLHVIKTYFSLSDGRILSATSRIKIDN